MKITYMGVCVMSLKAYVLFKMQRLKSLKIKKKFMIAFLFISLFSIVSVSSVSILISRNIIIENSENLANNLIKQIAVNIDERVKGFESTSYRILKTADITQLLNVRLDDKDNIEYYKQNTNFADIIIQQPALYSHTKMVFLKNSFADTYKYFNYGIMEISNSLVDEKIKKAKKKVNKTKPISWTVIDDEVVFVRLILDEKTYKEQGVLCFFMKPSFFQFIDNNKNILSNENIIITNSGRDILQNYKFDLKDQTIRKLIYDGRDNYLLKNHRILYKDQSYLVTSVISSQKNWKILSFISVKELMKNEKYIVIWAILIALISFLIAAIFTFFISKLITKNITIVEESMKKIEKGDFSTRIKPASYDEIGMLGLQFNYMTIQMKELIDTLAKEKTAKQRAEFQTLQAQINPHFLYNTLGSVKWLANRKEEKEIEEMMDTIISLMKASIKKTSEFVQVQEEILYVKNYIKLQKIRYGDLFHVNFNVEEETNNCLVLGFLLQPLVENAIFHGIDLSKTDGVITIGCKKERNNLVLHVEDNGTGITKERIEQIMHEEKQYKGFNSIGIKIVNDRLKLYYGERVSFQIKSKVGKGTVIKIILPYEKN